MSVRSVGRTPEIPRLGGGLQPGGSPDPALDSVARAAERPAATATSVRERVCLGHELVCESEGLLGVVLVLTSGCPTDLAEIGELWRGRCSRGRYGLSSRDRDKYGLLAVAACRECFGRLE